MQCRAVDKYDYVVKFNDDSDTSTNFKDDIKFLLYTNNDTDKFEKLWLEDENSLKRSFYKVSRPTKFVTHGWKNNYLGKNCFTVRKGNPILISLTK